MSVVQKLKNIENKMKEGISFLWSFDLIHTRMLFWRFIRKRFVSPVGSLCLLKRQKYRIECSRSNQMIWESTSVTGKKISWIWNVLNCKVFLAHEKESEEILEQYSRKLTCSRAHKILIQVSRYEMFIFFQQNSANSILQVVSHPPFFQTPPDFSRLSNLMYIVELKKFLLEIKFSV